MNRLAYVILFMLFTVPSYAQWEDRFSDGNYTVNPVWYASPNDWIVNSALQLQSNNTVANSVFHISTPSPFATSTQWELYCQLSFNPSSNNWVDIFVTTSDSNLQATNLTGYFIRLGNTDDDVCLYRKDAAGTETKIIDGANGVLNTSNNKLKLKLTRKGYSEWTLYYDLTGTGNVFTSAGSSIDSTYRTSSYFGIKVKQSTSGFFQKHFFDDIVVQSYVQDVTPPKVSTITIVDDRSLDILFSEQVTAVSSQATANYLLANSVSPSVAILDAVNPSLIHIQFSAPFAQNILIPLHIANVQDLAGNSMGQMDTSIYYFIPRPYDVIFHEIMADPSPQVSLPNAEWIEIKNTSHYPINLKNWILTDATHNNIPLPSYILPADSVVTLTASSSYNNMLVYGATLAVPSFPSLNNDGDSLFLISPYGKLISFVAYNTSWYRNTTKQDGGWSLEMIDDSKPCLGVENWKASENMNGGTPGQKNSVAAPLANIGPAGVSNVVVKDSVTIQVFMTRSIDTGSIKASSFTMLQSVPVLAVSILQPALDQVNIILAKPLQKNILYQLGLKSLYDCTGLNIPDTLIDLVLPSRAVNGDWVINEVLFNPRPSGSDYVEFYNKGANVLDAATLTIASRNASGTIVSIKKLSNLQHIIMPGDYIVVTTSASTLSREYFVKNERFILELPSLPAFTNNEGIVLAMDTSGVILDELHYYDNWHHELLTSHEGVALERSNANKQTNEKTNWHSAASTIGYGTPTYQNSQLEQQSPIQLTIDPATFSPDGDGYKDYTTINYKIDKPDFLGRFYIFDINGQLVKMLLPGGLTGTTGSLQWDGKNDRGQQLPVGNYILLLELYNTNGVKFKDKKVITITKKL